MNTSVVLWIKGLAAAAIGGASNVVTVMVVAPESFNIDNLPKVGVAAGIGALIAVAHYLKQAPVPPGRAGMPQ